MGTDTTSREPGTGWRSEGVILRRISERSRLTGPPFGLDPKGHRIDDVRGRLIRSVVKALEQRVTRDYLTTHDDEDGARRLARLTTEQLCERLNDTIDDPTRTIDRASLLNEWNRYSYEFYHLVMELAKEMSGDDQLLFQRGADSIPAPLVAFAQRLSLRHVYELIPRLAARLIPDTDLRVVSTERDHALIQMRLADKHREVVGPYWGACAENACASYKGALASIPALHSGRPWATVKEIQCQARGADFCEWLFEWNPGPVRYRWGSALGFAAGVLAGLGGMGAGLGGWQASGAVFGLTALGVVLDELINTRRELEQRRTQLRRHGEVFDAQYRELGQAQQRLQILDTDLQAYIDEHTRELRQANEELRRLAITDELTRLHNKRHFHLQLQAELERARRFGSSLSVLMLDVDHFKNYNDTHGHLAGDDALRLIGRILKNQTRATDTAARYGGEEFAILLPHTSEAEAFKVADKLREAVRRATELHLRETVTVSMGVSTLRDSRELGEELVRRADEALYGSKQSGRNRVTTGRFALPG